MILLHIRYYLSKPVKQHYLKYDFSNVQWDDMNQFFNQYNFTLALNSSNTEFIWSYLKTAINSAVNLYVPQVHVNKANQPKWFNSTIRHKIKSLRTIKRQLARHPTESRKLKVTSLQNEIQHMVAEQPMSQSLYLTMLALIIAKFFNTFRVSKNRVIFLPRCPIMMNLLLMIRTKPNYLISIFIQCLQHLITYQ